MHTNYAMRGAAFADERPGNRAVKMGKSSRLIGLPTLKLSSRPKASYHK